MELGTVGAFVVVDVLLILTPGADWAFVAAAAARGRPPWAAVTGLVLGYGVHTALVAAGLAAALAARPSLLTVVTVAGSAYLVWLGVSLVATRPDPPAGDTAGRSALATVLRGLGVSALNPKGLLLFLSLLPQFVDGSSGWPVAAQTLLLGGVHMTGCLVVYSAVGAFARHLLVDRPGAARGVSRLTGVVMVALGCALLVERLIL